MKDRFSILKLENDNEEVDTRTNELENFWSSIHGFQDQLSKPSWDNIPTISFEILSDSSGASFFMILPEKYKTIVMKKLNAVYPHIEINEVKEDHIENFKVIKENEYVTSCELVLTEDNLKYIKTKGGEKTFLNNLLNTINHYEEDDVSLVQLVIKPLPENWRIKRTNKLKKNKSLIVANFILDVIYKVLLTVVDIFVTKGDLSKNLNNKTKQVENIDNTKQNKEREPKNEKPCFNVAIRISTKSKDKLISNQVVKSVASVFKEFDDENKLRPIEVNIRAMIDRDIDKKSNVFSVNELSAIAHLPNKYVTSDNVVRSGVKTPYDKDVPSEGLIFGTYPQLNGKPVAFPSVPISIEKYQEIYSEYEKIIDNLCKPRLVLGQMGTGKSEWIINYAISLVKMGISVILVDPKNDTQKRIIESLPDEYINRVDYLNLGDLVYPPSLNLMRRRNVGDQTEASLIVQSLINFFKKEFSRSWGFAMQQLIMMTGNAILLDEVASLYEFQLMLTNKDYRQKIINKMKNIINDSSYGSKTLIKELYSFWNHFHNMTEKEQMERIKSTMNKIGVFMSNRIIRAIVSQNESYDFRKAGDNGRITIVNIPDGELGDENTALLASFINKAIWLDFRSRANIPIQQRYPTIWLIEEAHMVMDEEFIPVLTQSRGYRLGVTILTQGLTNFDNKGMKELRELILTNCKNKIIFRVGPQDASLLSDEFAPLTRYDLMNCPDYHFYSKILLNGGKVSKTFYAKSLDPLEPVRSYDLYKDNNRSGKLTIDEIEEQLDKRHENINQEVMIFDVGDTFTEEEIEKPKKRPKRKMTELIFLDD